LERVEEGDEEDEGVEELEEGQKEQTQGEDAREGDSVRGEGGEQREANVKADVVAEEEGLKADSVHGGGG